MLGGWIRRGSGPMVLDLTNHGFILSVLDVSGAAPRSAIFSRPGALSLRRKWQSIFRRHSCGWLCLAHASALERSPVTNLDGPRHRDPSNKARSDGAKLLIADRRRRLPGDVVLCTVDEKRAICMAQPGLPQSPDTRIRACSLADEWFLCAAMPFPFDHSGSGELECAPLILVRCCQSTSAILWAHLLATGLEYFVSLCGKRTTHKMLTYRYRRRHARSF